MVNIAFNQPAVTPPSQTQLLENKKTEVKTEINCMAIGTIVAFNMTDQTCTVQINYLRQIFGGALGTNDMLNNSTQVYPQLIKCPLMILAGGLSSLTFPIVSGDTCVVFFNDRDMDNWWSTGGTSSPPNSSRVHDLNDGIVFVGIRSMINALSTYNMNGPQLTNGNNFIAVESLIKLSVNSVTLGSTLNLIMIQLIALAEEVDPGIAATLTTLQTTLNGILS